MLIIPQKTTLCNTLAFLFTNCGIYVQKASVIMYKPKTRAERSVGLKKIISYSFKRSLPVMFGYLFLGTTFGILLRSKTGYGVFTAIISSTFVYAGSGQFLMCDLIKDQIPLYTAAVMTILLNSRHIFYGLSFISKFKPLGKLKFIPILELTDETYSVLCFTDKDKADPLCMLFISIFDHLYWIAGSVIGSLVSNLPFDFTGVEFSMTALFVVLFVDQWKSSKMHLPAITGFFSSVLFLILLGPDSFIFPSLLLSAIILIFAKSRIDGGDSGSESGAQNQSDGKQVES